MYVSIYIYIHLKPVAFSHQDCTFNNRFNRCIQALFQPAGTNTAPRFAFPPPPFSSQEEGISGHLHYLAGCF